MAKQTNREELDDSPEETKMGKKSGISDYETLEQSDEPTEKLDYKTLLERYNKQFAKGGEVSADDEELAKLKTTAARRDALFPNKPSWADRDIVGDRETARRYVGGHPYVKDVANQPQHLDYEIARRNHKFAVGGLVPGDESTQDSGGSVFDDSWMKKIQDAGDQAAANARVYAGLDTIPESPGPGELNSAQKANLMSAPNLDDPSVQAQIAASMRSGIELNPPETAASLPPKAPSETIPSEPVDLGQMDEKRSPAAGSSVRVNKPAPVTQPSQQQISSPEQVSPYGDELGDSRLKAAQEDAKRQMLIANLLEAGQTIGAGLTHQNLDASFADKLRKQSGQGVDDIMKRRQGMDEESQRNLRLSQLGTEEEMGNPNSQISKTYRDFAKKMGFTVEENSSARQLEKLTPLIERYAQMTESAKQRSHERELDREGKDDINLNKRGSELSNKLTAELASSRSAFGKAANIMRSAEALEQLSKQIPNPNDMTTRQIAEIARGLDAMLSQGVATVSGTKKLIPETASGDLAKIQEYISSLPKGAKQGAFVKQMMETVARERELAKEQIKKTGHKLLSGYQDIKNKKPELYYGILKAHELDGVFEEPSSKSKVSSKTVVKKGYNSKTNQTQLIYSDGTKEIVEGKQ